MSLPALGGCISASLSEGIFADIPVEQIPTPIEDIRNQPPVLAEIPATVAEQTTAQVLNSGTGDLNAELPSGTSTTDQISPAQEALSNSSTQQESGEPLQQLTERESLEVEIKLTKLLVARARTPADKLRHQLRLSYLEGQLANLPDG